MSQYNWAMNLKGWGRKRGPGLILSNIRIFTLTDRKMTEFFSW
jgi:hypothetical protein